MRTAEPIGGAYMQDVPGTAQGGWFLPGTYHSTGADLTSSLGLVSDYVEPAQPIIAMGTSVRGMKVGSYSFRVESQGLINRAFRDLTPNGSVYCYDRFLNGQSTGGLPLTRPDGVLLMSMPTGLTLKVELVAAGSCAAASRTFTGAATTFER
jgi:hypothetical protein